MMLLLSWCFIQTYHLSLSRKRLYLSWCSCCHGILCRHITSLSWNLLYFHDASVVMVFFQTNKLSLSRKHLYLSWCSCCYDVLSRHITCHVNNSFVFVMMHLLLWCFIWHCHNLLYHGASVIRISRLITCHCWWISCNWHDAPVVVFLMKAYHLSLSKNLL